MSLLYLVDTNIASYYLRRSAASLEARLSEGLQRQTLAISVLTRAELRFGQAAMADDDRRRKLIDQFLLLLPNLPWTPHAADQYGALRAPPCSGRTAAAPRGG